MYHYPRVELEAVGPLHKPMVAGSIPAGGDRFSGCENRRHMIMWHTKDSLSINLALVLTAIMRIRRELELK
ncbi:hypothetical protein TNCV_1666171 [Trichonephila clavipes]|nr:hypothetical protein TNCV_1666171 [Trichonephila clavipes]